MANWNLSKRLFMGVGSLVLLLLVSGAVSFITGRSMKAQLDSATKQTARQLELALQLQRDGVSLSNLQRGLLLAALGGDQNGQKQTAAVGLGAARRHEEALRRDGFAARRPRRGLEARRRAEEHVGRVRRERRAGREIRRRGQRGDGVGRGAPEVGAAAQQGQREHAAADGDAGPSLRRGDQVQRRLLPPPVVAHHRRLRGVDGAGGGRAVGRQGHHHHAAHRDARPGPGRAARRHRLVAGGQRVAVAVAGRHRAGGVARSRPRRRWRRSPP